MDQGTQRADIGLGTTGDYVWRQNKRGQKGIFKPLPGFITNTRATPDNDLALARKRQKELE